MRFLGSTRPVSVRCAPQSSPTDGPHRVNGIGGFNIESSEGIALKGGKNEHRSIVAAGPPQGVGYGGMRQLKVLSSFQVVRLLGICFQALLSARKQSSDRISLISGEGASHG